MSRDEKKFAMDEETKFKAISRRNRFLGLWAAEKLGKTGQDADDYAQDVYLANLGAALETCKKQCAELLGR